MSLKKRSITLHSHRTSLALEPEFWEGLEAIAHENAQSLSSVIAEIDDTRAPEESLSSCVRVAVLNFYKTN